MLGTARSMPDYLPSHTISYFKKSGGPGSEFFADYFAELALNNQNNLSIVKKYLPKSANACEELIDILMKKH